MSEVEGLIASAQGEISIFGAGSDEAKIREWRYWLNIFLATLLASVLALAGLIVWLSYRQVSSYLHPPRQIASGNFLAQGGIEFQIIELTTADDIRLHAWYTPPQNGTVILVAHGHAGTIPEDMYALFARNGYGVLAWNVRAHGRSGGDFTSLGYYETLDVKAALDYALAQPGVEHVGAWGGSMGAATAIRAAAQYPEIEAVVADSGYATLEDVLIVRIPYPALRPLFRFFAEQETGVRVDDVRPVDDIRRISPRPVYLIQGMRDTAVPSNSAQRLFDAAKEPRFLWTEESAYHLNMYPEFPEEYEKRVIGFFDAFLHKK